MFCTNCGIELTDEMNFCPKCGTKKNVLASTTSKHIEERISTDKVTEEYMPFSEKYKRCIRIKWGYVEELLLEHPYGEECVLINDAKERISKVYTWISPLYNGYATVNVGGDYYYGKDNLTGEYRMLCGKWGVIDENGKEVCSPIYDYIGYISQDGIALVNQGGSIIEVSNGWDHNAVCIGGKYGFINKTGKLVCDLKYDSADGFYNKLCKVNNEATESIESYVNDGRDATYKKTEGGKWGIINQDGLQVVPCIYDKLEANDIPILISKHKNEDIPF